MRLIRQLKVTLALLGLASLLFTAGAQAEPLLPEIPKGKGKQCVEPTPVMRRNHFEYILHQRTETLHEGIRTKKYSLVECINCHVVPNEKGEYPKFGSDEHFCSSCHNYASVHIDCFQCHADKPEVAYEGKVGGYQHALGGSNPHHFANKAAAPLSKGDLELVSAENNSHE